KVPSAAAITAQTNAKTQRDLEKRERMSDTSCSTCCTCTS
ncbi:hypothetical protein A2U01_0095335, partial [Trifolium medium]|nr:hypothetical protein [Trifolium medium]